MLDTVKINHVQHISFTQSRLTDAVSVILSELLSYEHPSNAAGLFFVRAGRCGYRPPTACDPAPADNPHLPHNTGPEQSASGWEYPNARSHTGNRWPD